MQQMISLNKDQEIIIFCDDSKIANVPKETPEQKEKWEKEKQKLLEKLLKKYA